MSSTSKELWACFTAVYAFFADMYLNASTGEQAGLLEDVRPSIQSLTQPHEGSNTLNAQRMSSPIWRLIFV